MMLLRMLGCAVFGHAPIAERRGADCVLACERCQRLLEVFVKNLYAGEDIVVGATGKCEDQGPGMSRTCSHLPTKETRCHTD